MKLKIRRKISAMTTSSICEVSTFQTIKKLINATPINSIIERHLLVAKCRHASQCTIDNYRNMLTACGYLKIHSRGKYTVLQHINSDLTVSQLRYTYENLYR